MKTEHLFFVPGGPWINGQYWDKFISDHFSNFLHKRHVLINHEVDYNKNFSPKLLDAIRHLDNDIQNIQGSYSIIAHSYGAWLVLLWIKVFQKCRANNIIFLNMPTDQLRTKEMHQFIKTLSTKDLTTNNDFSVYFKSILPCYFFSQRETSTHAYIANEGYKVGNEELVINTDLLIELMEFKNELRNINYIFCDKDLITGLSWKNLVERADMIQECGHFPMLEKPQDLAKILNSLL